MFVLQFLLNLSFDDYGLQQTIGNVVSSNRFFEDLDGAKNCISFRDSLFHEVFKFLLEIGCRVVSNKVFLDFSGEIARET